jgi:hypothetical protein
MAAPTTVTGSDVLWSYSTDGGTTYKTVVCKQQASLTRARSVSVEETDCGVIKALGPDNSKISFTGVLDTVPDSGEGSHTELTVLYDANTEFTSKFATAGNEPYATGLGKLSNLDVTVDAPSASVKFSATFEFTGTVDTTA